MPLSSEQGEYLATSIYTVSVEPSISIFRAADYSVPKLAIQVPSGETCLRGHQCRNLLLLCRLVDVTDVSDKYTASIFRLDGSSTRGLCTGTSVSEQPAASIAKGLSDQEIPSRVTSVRFFAVLILSKISCPPHSQATLKRVALYATGRLGFVSRLTLWPWNWTFK